MKKKICQAQCQLKEFISRVISNGTNKNSVEPDEQHDITISQKELNTSDICERSMNNDGTILSDEGVESLYCQFRTADDENQVQDSVPFTDEMNTSSSDM